MNRTCQSNCRQSPPCLHRNRRSGFTLVELLISIAVIGILAALALGAMNKATTRSKAMKTQSTVAKLHQQIMGKWESYKFRRLPIDPTLILQSGGNTYITNQIAAMVNHRAPLYSGSGGTDPLNVFNSAAQKAAVKLLAMRELQRYEMPTGWSDIIDTDQLGNYQGAPGAWNMRSPQVLLVPPQLAQAYLIRVNSARDSAGNKPSQEQIKMYDAAETLYMIVKLACEDENNALADSVKEVGDADGDGLPEFQDAFAGMDQNYTTTAAANNPIFWNRWPAGYVNLNRMAGGAYTDALHFSDFQDDPINLVEESSTGGLQVVADMTTFCADNHDYFDPMRLDIPGAGSGPRGYQLTPLIYSAGIDSKLGLAPTAWNDPTFTVAQQNSLINDPYATDSQGRRNADWGYAAGQPLQGTQDNITSHALNAR